MKLQQDVLDGMLRHVAEMQADVERTVEDGTICTLVMGLIYEEGDHHHLSTTIDGNGEMAKECLAKLLRHFMQLATGTIPPCDALVDESSKEPLQ